MGLCASVWQAQCPFFLNPGLSVGNPSFSFDNPRFSRKTWDLIIQVFSTFPCKSLIIKSKNLDFNIVIQVFRIIGQWASKILDFQVIIQVFQVSF